jgi:serine/threonine-protein kinase
VLKLAEATEGDGLNPSGTEIVRAYAPDLLEIGNLLETVRAPKPAVNMPAPLRTRYQRGERLGAGGMAEVFRGTMTGVEGVARPVAMKCVLPGMATPAFLSMFVQEAQLVSMLSHKNIVPLLDFDRDSEGRLFLVMEYVEGRDLASLAETGLLPFSTVNYIVSEILSGLGYAHDLPMAGPVRGLVHRDVSPSNVLLSWEGAVKVSDFGIAKAREASAATASLFVKGKVAYMSPEQANGEPLDGRSDLFAVGIVAWELLTGRPLFGDGSVPARETLAKVILGPIPRPSSSRPEIPADLEAVVMKLLERDKSARYARADLAIDALENCADAPRNGGRELARLLATRFPQAIAARSSPPQPGERPRPDPSAKPQDRVTVRGSNEPPGDSWRSAETTHGTAASQFVYRSRRGANWPLGGLVLLCAAAGAIALVVATRGHNPEPSALPTPPLREAAGSGTPRDVKPTSPTLTVVTEPPGAAIHIDGSPRGKAPLTIPLDLGNRVLIEAAHDGFESAQQIITAERAAQTVTISLTARTTTKPAHALPDARPATRPMRDIKPSQQTAAPPPKPADAFNEDDVR